MSVWSYLAQPVTREMFGFKPARKPGVWKRIFSWALDWAARHGGRVVGRLVERLVDRSLKFVILATAYGIVALLYAAMFLLPVYGFIRFVKFAWAG